MPRGWLKNIETIVQKGEEKVREAERARLKREEERRKKINDVKGVIKSCLNDVIELLQKYDVKGSLIEDDETILLKMPDLSEVNRANLLFEIACTPEKTSWKVGVTAFKIDAETPNILSGLRPGEDIEGFVARVTEEFLEGWYKRKLSDELNKEREWQLKISSQPLTGKGE